MDDKHSPMDFIKGIASKAQQILESSSNQKNLTKDQILCREFRLPDSEAIVNQSLVEIFISSSYLRARVMHMREMGMTPDAQESFNGKLTLTQDFLVFVDSYNELACSFVIQLPMVKRIQRIHRAYDFAIALMTMNGLEITIKFIGIKSQCERFGQHLVSLLRKNLPEVDAISEFRKGLYSEFLLSKNKCNSLEVNGPPAGGLGWIFKFPGNTIRLKDRRKMRRWFDFYRENGRNFALVRNVTFYRLVSYGLPNKLRGEIWETCSGSIYLRYLHANEYEKILADHVGEKSQAIEEIEKDLNRSLPEYPAYQNAEGINRLRRVLSAYSWKNPDVGYCQAMNIVTAALLIYMSEEQVFWCLNVLCDKIIPGYYSKTMYGVMLDQKVFDSLVSRTLPLLDSHFKKHDVQLSIITLPWFLSFFLSNMPLIYAFRIVDMLLLHGPKVLFQISLAIIRVNGESLLECEEDGDCIAIFKDYFTTLSDPEVSIFKQDRVRTRFDNLWEVAFREFSMIDDKTIKQLRAKHSNEVFQGIETFIKRTELRNLPKTHNLTKTQISNIYDRYYHVLMGGEGNPPDQSSCNMDFDSFMMFMSQLVDWIDIDDESSKKIKFLTRLYMNWSNDDGIMNLASLVVGIDKLVDKDIMNSLSNFIALYDDMGDGKIGREGIINLAEDLIFITAPWREGKLFDDLTNQAIEAEIARKIVERREFLKERGMDVSEDEIQLPDQVRFNQQKWQGRQTERYLKSGSTFLQMTFKYAQPADDLDKPLIDLGNITDNTKEENSKHNAALDPSRPVYITASTFRMVILADETYESFFRTQFWKSFHVDEKINEKVGVVDNIRGMFNHFLADGRRVAVQVRKRMDDAAKSGKNNSAENINKGVGMSSAESSKRSKESSSLSNRSDKKNIMVSEDNGDKSDGDDEDEENFGDFVGTENDDFNDIPIGGNELKVLHTPTEIKKEAELVRSFKSTGLN